MEHIVLDLDHTLLVGETTTHTGLTPLNVLFESGDPLYMYLRPHAIAFLQACVTSFKTVSIWTAGTTEWLHTFLTGLERVNPQLRSQLLFTWDRTHTTTSHRVPYFKDLHKLWTHEMGKRVGMTAENVCLVDDNLDLMFYWTNNLICITPWEDTTDQTDTVLLEVLERLQLIAPPITSPPVPSTPSIPAPHVKPLSYLEALVQGRTIQGH